MIRMIKLNGNFQRSPVFNFFQIFPLIVIATVSNHLKPGLSEKVASFLLLSNDFFSLMFLVGFFKGTYAHVIYKQVNFWPLFQKIAWSLTEKFLETFKELFCETYGNFGLKWKNFQDYSNPKLSVNKHSCSILRTVQ